MGMKRTHFCFPNKKNYNQDTVLHIRLYDEPNIRKHYFSPPPKHNSFKCLVTRTRHTRTQRRHTHGHTREDTVGWYITQPVVTRITNPSTRRTQKREMRNDEKLFAKIKQNGPNRARKIKNGDTYCNIICWIFVFFCVFFSVKNSIFFC